MSRLPVITGEFRLTDDPELRFTPGGKAVANMTIVTNESKKTDTGWEDGDRTPFIRIAVWDTMAEECAEHLRKGDKVLVTGALYARQYDKNDGTKGESIELKWVTVAPIPGGRPKAKREQAGGQQYADDPWTTAAPGQPVKPNVPDDPWGTGNSSEPPF